MRYFDLDGSANDSGSRLHPTSPWFSAVVFISFLNDLTASRDQLGLIVAFFLVTGGRFGDTSLFLGIEGDESDWRHSSLRILHLHGASIGEIKCLFRLLEDLHSKAEFQTTDFLLTYTSTSAREWLEKLPRLPSRVSADFWGRTSRQHLTHRLHAHPPAHRGCIIAEKDRWPSLLDIHGSTGMLINIEAKPPQSRLSRIYERRYAKSIQRIPHFAVENEEYREDILSYSPNANVAITGTLKAPPVGRQLAETSRPRLAFVSVMPHEAAEVAKQITALHAQVPAQVIVIPRYVTTAKWSLKDRDRSIRLFRTHIPNCVLVSDPEHLSRQMDSAGDRPAVFLFTEIGKVLDILHLVRVAIIGGSLSPGFMTRSKGHNFFEPLAASIPTLIGPYHQNWAYSVKAFADEGTLLVVGAPQLVSVIVPLLTNDGLYTRQRNLISRSALLKFHQEAVTRVSALVCALASSAHTGR